MSSSSSHFFSDNLSESVYSGYDPESEEILTNKVFGVYIVHDDEIKKNVVQEIITFQKLLTGLFVE